MPADCRAGEDREPVHDRVEQGAEAAVLAGRASDEAVEQVTERDREEDRRGERVAAVAGAERDREEDRDRGEADVADQVRRRERAQRLARPGLRRLGPGAVDPEQAAAGLGGALARGGHGLS
jgi:hypothetical protein